MLLALPLISAADMGFDNFKTFEEKGSPCCLCYWIWQKRIYARCSARVQGGEISTILSENLQSNYPSGDQAAQDQHEIRDYRS